MIISADPTLLHDITATRRELAEISIRLSRAQAELTSIAASRRGTQGGQR